MVNMAAAAMPSVTANPAADTLPRNDAPIAAPAPVINTSEDYISKIRLPLSPECFMPIERDRVSG